MKAWQGQDNVDDAIPFSVGCVLLVFGINQEDPTWTFVRNEEDNREGVIPTAAIGKRLKRTAQPLRQAAVETHSR